MKNFEKFINEELYPNSTKPKVKRSDVKMGFINFSDLHDNWSAEYHLSDELKDLKINYKELGRFKFIDKVINIVNKIDKNTYDQLAAESKLKYHVGLPAYKSAASRVYWSKNFSSIAKLIITMSALTDGINIQKEKIQSEIEILKNKLDKLESLDEGLADGKWGFGNTTFNKDYKPNTEDKYEYIGYNEEPDNGDTPIEVYDEVYELGIEVEKEELENYISLDTLKELLPVYNDVDFYNDWSVKCYEKDNYFLIQNSGWLYLFRKK